MRISFPLLGGAAILASCAAQDEKTTLAQQLREDSTLLMQLASYEAPERNQGVARIKSLGQEQGTWLILNLLMDPTLDDYRVEVVLARLLADWKDARAIGYLLQSVKLPDDGAVNIAAEGLLVFGDNEHVMDALREMLSDPLPRDRLTAAKILSQVHTPRAAEVLAERFKEETDKEIRALLLLGVMESRYPQRRQFMIDALVDADVAIRELAWQGLKDYPGLPKVAYDPDGPLEERAKGVAELRLWQKRAR